MKSTTALIATTTWLLTCASFTTCLVTGSNILAQQQRPIRLLHRLASHSSPSSSSINKNIQRQQTSESTVAGAILSFSSPPVHSTQGTFRVPIACMPTSGPTANNPVGIYAASFQIGIDSLLCQKSLRLGIDIVWDGTLGGEQTPFAWHHYLPDFPVSGFAKFSVAAGDLVRLTASTSAEEMMVKIENFGNCTTTTTSPKAVAEHSFPAPVEEEECDQQAAGWMIEDLLLAGLPDIPVALANFTAVQFGILKVSTEKGETVNAKGAEVKNIYQQAQGGRLTDCAVAEDGGSMKCERIVVP
ncbi:concanavalin A-like lectin/glucanase domain-containing protein [Apodospora peruviana]|uniref:Concanavalin A-like lectin/glucanase domain-containing protein n=1 Tax=Apodospora peruviana TaxID=516989 RepID=A0AAE0MAQ4_9PEZI|nr:concanavalin A-like lectin/glucanase domain-containing protein [Apodospora peruviana]